MVVLTFSENLPTAYLLTNAPNHEINSVQIKLIRLKRRIRPMPCTGRTRTI